MLPARMRLEVAMQEAIPNASPSEVKAFALDHAYSNNSELAAGLDGFILKMNVPPEIPGVPPNGWKFYVRVPLCTIYKDDGAEQHARAAEAAVLAASNPSEAGSYVIDVFKKNEKAIANFEGTKKLFTTLGKDPAELLLFHNILDEPETNFGHGFYFSEYPLINRDHGNSRFLCKVLPGRTQTRGKMFDPERFDSHHVVERHAGVEVGRGRNIHVINDRNQILPFCVVHTQKPDDSAEPESSFKQASNVSFRMGPADLAFFDEQDEAQMSARVALSRVLRGNGDSLVSSVVYVESAEAKAAFQAMKCQLAEDKIDNKEVLLFHHANVWNPSFFSQNEFNFNLIRSNAFGSGFMLTDWLGLDTPHASIVVVYRVLLGKVQTKGERLSRYAFNSLRLPRKFQGDAGDAARSKQFTYVVGSELQLLPYCVVTIKNEEARRNLVVNIMRMVRPSTTTPFAHGQIPKPACVICGRTSFNLMKWFGCASACALCADFFRRTCIGSNFFVEPEDCEVNYSCRKCSACLLRRCLDCGMNAAALASHFDLSEAHLDEVDAKLAAFNIRSAEALDWRASW